MLRQIYWPALLGFIVIPTILVIWILWGAIRSARIWWKNRHTDWFNHKITTLSAFRLLFLTCLGLAVFGVEWLVCLLILRIFGMQIGGYILFGTLYVIASIMMVISIARKVIKPNVKHP